MAEPVVLASMAFVIACACALIMGYAIQRGATCLVAAVDEVLVKRRAKRFIALGEAAIWVAGSIFVWRFFGGEPTLPIGYPTTFAAAAGGVLLGLGALVSGACVFGAVARFGSGEWVFVLVPLGFFLGCWTILPMIGSLPPKHAMSPPLFAESWLLWPFALVAAWRVYEAVQAARRGGLAAHIWSPHRATAIIGIVFGISVLAIGPWAYTYALAALAQGTTNGVIPKLVLLVALLAGALAGGWTAGRFALRAPSVALVARSLAGGVLMGWGSLLIPGGNDELLLIGIPMLQPYAWVAVAAMAVAIAVGRVGERRFASLVERLRLR
ncbi:YeeE/YedE thiosulfate transporter family protein [Sphingomonas sp.]|uniref:YeeE/YedE thiosulfate transporter family protein n=1 Tax=Sphingomonas sp. TaxID=28214 RepID=UPI0035A8D378